jgi:hypothetical protein
MTKKTDLALEFAKKYLSGNILRDDILVSTPKEQDFLRVGNALEIAASKPNSLEFDVLVTIAADILSRNERMPEWLATFAADVLLGKRKRPTKRGPQEFGNWERDYKLWRATQEVAKVFGLQHYSNNELSKRITAAEIVSRAEGCSLDVVVTAYKKYARKWG